MNNDKLQQTIQRAKDMGYSPAQIRAVLQSKGLKADVPDDGIVAETVRDVKETGAALKGTIDQGVEDAEKARALTEAGKQSAGSGFFQTLGGLGRAAARTVTEVVTGAGKALLPQGAEDVIGEGAKKVGKAIATTAPAQAIAERYAQLEKDDPTKAANLLAVLGLGELASSGLGGAAAKPAAAVAKEAAKATGKTAAAAADKTVKGAKASVGKVADAITLIDSGTESVLDSTRLIPKEKLKSIPQEKIVAAQELKSAKLDRYAKQAEKAVNDFSQPTPMAIAGTQGDKALTVLSNKLSKQGDLKRDALEANGGLEVPGVGALRAKLRDELRDRVGVNIIKTADGVATESAKGRVSKVAFDPADNKLMTDAYRLLTSLGDKPTLREIDDTVDALQDLLYKRRSTVAVPVNGQVESVLKSITGELNAAAKKVGGDGYRKANEKLAHFIDIRDKLNRALGAEGVRGASLMKQLFSPSGEAPRRLFEQVKELTGIDLVEEATLAKFVMENVGDARQASLLEEVINSGSVTPRSFIGKAADRVIRKIQNPIAKARRVIDRPGRRLRRAPPR